MSDTRRTGLVIAAMLATTLAAAEEAEATRLHGEFAGTITASDDQSNLHGLIGGANTPVAQPIIGRFSIGSGLATGAGWLTSSFTVAGVTRAVGARLAGGEELFVLDSDGGDQLSAFDSERRGDVADDLLAARSDTLRLPVYELIANFPFGDGMASLLNESEAGANVGRGSFGISALIGDYAEVNDGPRVSFDAARRALLQNPAADSLALMGAGLVTMALARRIPRRALRPAGNRGTGARSSLWDEARGRWLSSSFKGSSRGR
jgi:hypothetical protein